MKLICEGDDRIWLEIDDNITRAQVNQFIEAAEKNDIETMLGLMKDTITDAQIVANGETVRGFENIKNTDPQDFSLMSEAFWDIAYVRALGEMRQLGNAIRRD